MITLAVVIGAALLIGANVALVAILRVAVRANRELVKELREVEAFTPLDLERFRILPGGRRIQTLDEMAAGPPPAPRWPRRIDQGRPPWTG